MFTIDNDLTLPTDNDTRRAEELRRALARAGSELPLRIQVEAASHEITTYDLPPVVSRLLIELLKETAAGHAVSVIPLETEITTQQAAEILSVSRPHVVSLVEKGVFAVRMVGNQRRLPLRDVLSYKAEHRARRRETLREMAALDQDLGLI